MNHRLLIVSCSGRKDPAEGLLPAIDRYRPGAYYQMIHQVPESLRPDIIILSALYGYMNPCRLLPDYDFKMDRRAADNLMADPEHWADLKLLVQPWHTDIMIVAGKLYREVIDYHAGFGIFAGNATVQTATGGIGDHRSQLKRWLNQRLAA